MTRSAISTTFPGSTILGQFARLLADVVKALQDRREVRNLAEFDDRMLKDIGLVRSDVDSALSEPIFHKPSWVLVRCAGRHARSQNIAVPARGSRPIVPMVRRPAIQS